MIARIFPVLGLVALLAQPVAADPSADALSAYDAGDYAAALEIWRPQAEAGSAEALFNLGLLYEHGQGVEADAEAAMTHYRQAAEAGNLSAQIRLADMLLATEDAAQAAEAVHWLTEAAEREDPVAQSRLGTLYANGIGVERDLRLASSWYTRATENSCTDDGRAGAAEPQKVTALDRLRKLGT